MKARRERAEARTAATPPPRMTYLKCLAITPHAGRRQAAGRNDTIAKGADRRVEAGIEWNGRVGGQGEDRSRSLSLYTLPASPCFAGKKIKKARPAFRALPSPIGPAGRFVLMRA